MRAKGLEPPHLAIPGPKPGASTSSATPAGPPVARGYSRRGARSKGGRRPGRPPHSGSVPTSGKTGTAYIFPRRARRRTPGRSAPEKNVCCPGFSTCKNRDSIHFSAAGSEARATPVHSKNVCCPGFRRFSQAGRLRPDGSRKDQPIAVSRLKIAPTRSAYSFNAAIVAGALNTLGSGSIAHKVP